MRKLGRILWRHLACVQGLAGAPAVLAEKNVPPAVMLTDSRAPAVLALAAFAVMLTDARARAPWQMLAPPQSSGLQTSCRRSAAVMPVLTRTDTRARPRAGRGKVFIDSSAVAKFLLATVESMSTRNSS